MALGIGQSAGLIFKIDADSSGAIRELKAVDASINNLGGKLSSFGSIAAVGAAGLAAVGAAAVTASVAMFNLAKSTSEYGSEIFDATQKTGLGAEAISSLKIAAEQSGSSLEAVTKGITIFAKNYKGTSQDLEGELGKLFKRINDAKPGFEQLTLATKSFGKAGADLIPVIKSFDGDLPGLIDKLKKMGVTMTDQDAKAADEFGDTLDMLGTQAAGVGRQFASELMPLMTSAMSAISKAMADNQGVVREWGQNMTNTINGAVFVAQTAAGGINAALRVITAGLVTNENQWQVWGYAVRLAVMLVVGPLGAVIDALNLIGRLTGGAQASGQGQWLGPSAMAAPPTIAMPKMPGGGGKGGGKGGGADNAAADAEKARREAVQAAKAEMQDTLEIYRAGYAERLALLDFNLESKYTSELNYIRDVGRIHLEALEDEKRLNAELLKNENLNLEEKTDIANKIKVLEIEIRTEKQKTATEVLKQIKKEDEAAEEAHQKELKRLQDISKKRQEAFLEEQYRRKRAAEDAEREKNKGKTDILGPSPIVKLDEFGRFEKIVSAIPTLAKMAGAAINELAQGVGSLVQNWVLMGTAGPHAMRKLVASVLAGVAAQAAVLAIMELAYGIAALTPWGFAIYGSPVAHFKAAALFGAVAVGAAIAGRAVAGDLFQQQAAGPSGSSSSSSSGSGNRGGGAYSGQPDQVVNGGINSTGGNRGLGTIVIRDKSGMFDQLFEAAWENNGRMRRTILGAIG